MHQAETCTELGLDVQAACFPITDPRDAGAPVSGRSRLSHRQLGKSASTSLSRRFVRSSRSTSSRSAGSSRSASPRSRPRCSTVRRPFGAVPSTGRARDLGILLAYNLIRIEMERTADDFGVEPRQISFVSANAPHLRHGGTDTRGVGQSGIGRLHERADLVAFRRQARHPPPSGGGGFQGVRS
jgi:hypothetical protein